MEARCVFSLPLRSLSQSALPAAVEWSRSRRTLRAWIPLGLLLAALALPWLAGASPVQALQDTPPVALRGTVSTVDGRPVGQADVFLLETLEGATSGADGSFVIRSAHRGRVTVVVHGDAVIETRREVTLPRAEPLHLEVREPAVRLDSIVVEAGRYDSDPGGAGVLTPLDVVSIPGATADVLQALAAFPGVQPVEEGAALFVRGGDVSETKVLLDGAVVLAPYRFESGILSFGTFDPFELEGISFSSGGFGARHGDALSGLVELETAGAAEQREMAATASLAAVSGQVRLPLSETLGVRATANRSHTGLMFRVNGHETDFTRVPESRNASVSGTWEYRPGGRLKLYAFDEWNRFAVDRTDAARAGEVAGDDASGMVVLSLRDGAGDVGVRSTLAVSRRENAQNFGAFELEERDRLVQGRLSLSTSPILRVDLDGGVVLEGRLARIAGSYPAAATGAEAGAGAGPGDRQTVFDSSLSDRRLGLFGQARFRPTERIDVTAGVRADRSTLTQGWTTDPRISGAVRIADAARLTFSWGRYHQRPAPLMYEPEVGVPDLPAMRARHRVVGLVAGGDRRMVRVEAYDKRQTNLAALDRDHRVQEGGSGRARGVDLFLRGPAPFGMRGRLSYSFIDADRTDPDTGEMARSPFEIRHALTLILDRTLGERWTLGGALRHASGRPFTPVAGRSRPDPTAPWQPEYGDPWSERLRSYTRLDLTGQFLHGFGDDRLLVAFVSVTNVLGRANAAEPGYNADYSEMRPIESAYGRTLYFGVTTTVPF